MELSIVFSILFFIAFILYFFMGIFVLNINGKSAKNILFFVNCALLCFWSFGFAIANSASDYGTALLWRRISAVGWGSLFSFMLHFILILTGQSAVLKKKWLYVLIYFPAVVNLYIFSFNKTIATGQYNLYYSSSGWINRSVNNSIDWFYNIYYSCFLVICLIVLVLWRLSCNPKDKSTARLLIISIFFAFILGSLTDIIFSIYIPGEVPQMAPIFIIVPLVAIYYSIKKYDLMKNRPYRPLEEGVILDDYKRAKVYHYLSLSFITGGFISIISSYFIYRAPLNATLVFSAALIFLGVLVQLFNRLYIMAAYKDLFVIIIMSLTIPLIIANFSEYASITVWVIPAVFLMLCILFKQRWFIALIYIVTLLSLIWVWIKVPSVSVTVEKSDYLTRIFIITLLSYIALFVNKMFIARLEESETQMKLYRMVSEVSRIFVSSCENSMDNKINKLLQLSGEQFQSDRAFFFFFSDNNQVIFSNEWYLEGMNGLIDIHRQINFDNFPWLKNQIYSGHTINITDLELLPPEADSEKKILQREHIRSFILAPVISSEKSWGFIGFNTHLKNVTWKEVHSDALKVIAYILAEAKDKAVKEEKIKQLALYDTLTGLPNRALFNAQLEKEISLASRVEELIGVIFIDLDSFKAVNDTLGHHSGDEVLKQFSQKISKLMRNHDMVSRFGGDEFIIMINNPTQVQDITNKMDTLMNMFHRPIIINGQEFYVTASAGIAVYPIDGEDADTLIKNADIAMYASKEQGKNRYTLCSPILKEDIQVKIKLTNELYRALEREELEIYYQPQLCIATQIIVGLEALIRWRHPEMGMISPVRFIPLAEQTGLINPIGEWVLRNAAKQNVIWHKMGIKSIRMAVNVSVIQYNNPKFIEIVKKVIKETGIKPEYLELEITESTAVKGSTNIIKVLNELKGLGVDIAIDDFGTEYSSLSRLKLLPIDRIKMDMQFVQSISISEKDDAIAKIIIQLAKNLKLKVIAEGVESPTQLDFLSENGCDEVQGFYYYKPMSAKEVEAILIKQMEECDVAL